jgi:hypothetical protein
MIFKIKENKKEETSFFVDITFNKTQSNILLFYIIPIFKKEKYKNPVFKYTSFDYIFKIFIVKINIHYATYKNFNKK